MDDLIKRLDALDEVERLAKYFMEKFHEYAPSTIAVTDAIKAIPSAQKKGHWIYDSEAYPLGNPYGHYDCDQCGESVPHKTNFCPNCGADMREETDEC